MKNKVKKFLVLSLLGLLVVNITFISAVYVINYSKKFTLYPGEEYTINFPFIGLAKIPVIKGIAKTTSEIPMPNVTISVYDVKANKLIKKVTTDEDGFYQINLPEINKKTEYNISIEYNNQTADGDILLANNNYTIEYDEDENYILGDDKYVILSGSIYNEYADIENGRIEVNLRYLPNYPSSDGAKYMFQYQTYRVNVEAGDTYDFPSEEFNISWEIPLNASAGHYKFLARPSFNGHEKSTGTQVEFTLTE